MYQTDFRLTDCRAHIWSRWAQIAMIVLAVGLPLFRVSAQPVRRCRGALVRKFATWANGGRGPCLSIRTHCNALASALMMNLCGRRMRRSLVRWIDQDRGINDHLTASTSLLVDA